MLSLIASRFDSLFLLQIIMEHFMVCVLVGLGDGIMYVLVVSVFFFFFEFVSFCSTFLRSLWIWLCYFGLLLIFACVL